MAEEDNFDIDIYGDDAGNDYQGEPEEPMQDAKQDDGPTNTAGDHSPHDAVHGAEAGTDSNEMEVTTNGGVHDSHDHKPSQTQTPAPQGTKRKEGPDDRPVDPNATTAIVLGELHWWTTEDDIRGWINKSGCEDELKDISFNEHKVNGKSKGQAFVEFHSTQAATALKHRIDSFATSTDTSPVAAALRKHTANFHPAGSNPYRTLPKDVPGRNRDSGREGHSRPPYSQSGGNYSGFNRGGRGGFGNRGGNAGGGYGNRNFSGGAMQGGGVQGGNFGGNFAGPPMNQFGGGFNRGGMMGGNMRGGMGGSGRGGRGGAAMNPGMMGGMGMPMGNMGMPNMNMGMGGMGGMGSMGMPGFTNPQHFNAGGGFFNQGQQGGSDGNWNPHGAKRPRPE